MSEPARDVISENLTMIEAGDCAAMGWVTPVGWEHVDIFIDGEWQSFDINERGELSSPSKGEIHPLFKWLVGSACGEEDG